MSGVHAVIPNHTVDPATGFIESKNYIDAFDGQKKQIFLKVFWDNCLSLYETCDQLGISYHTVNKHYKLDLEFQRAYDELELKYAHQLQAVGRRNALNPKSVIERIWQQKSLSNLPGFERYAEQKNGSSTQISISIDGNLIQAIQQRDQVIDVVPTVNDTLLAQSTTSTVDSTTPHQGDAQPSVEKKGKRGR